MQQLDRADVHLVQTDGAIAHLVQMLGVVNVNLDIMYQEQAVKRVLKLGLTAQRAIQVDAVLVAKTM